MKLGNLKLTALAASVAMLLTGAAKADLNYDTSNFNDVVAAFSTGGNFPHMGNTYLVNFGNLSLYTGAFADGNVHLLSNSGSSILADLGTAGITTGAGTWSLFGADGDASSALLSRAETINGTPSANTYSKGFQGSAPGDMLTMVFSMNPSSGTTANSAFQSSSDTNSYASFVFGSNSQTLAWEQYAVNPEGGLSQVLDLYALSGTGSGPATLVGGFKFDSATGLVSFSSDLSDFGPAVPEPATFGFAAALIGFCAFRRVRQTALLVA